MDYWLINNLLTLGLAILLTGIIIPKILTIAFRKNLFDKVDARKIHHGAIPRLGGIAFVPSIIFAVLLTVGIGLKFNSEAMLKVLGPAIVPVLFLVCALMLLFLIGIADDLIGVSYNSKFAVQILCAVLMLVSGVRIDNLYGFLGLHELPLWLSYLGTALLVVFIVNAINLIDGIDGLCSGLSAICLFCYGTLFILTGQYLYSMISWATFGCLVPFFYFNIFGDVNRRRKIFMGDTGSLTLGGIIAVLAILIHKELLLPLLCAIFYVEDLSVMLQVGYFKYTKRKYGAGRRIFKMTPLHHHFQKAGNSGIEALLQKPLQAIPESKIVTRFWIVGIFLAVITFVTLKIR